MTIRRLAAAAAAVRARRSAAARPATPVAVAAARRQRAARLGPVLVAAVLAAAPAAAGPPEPRWTLCPQVPLPVREALLDPGGSPDAVAAADVDGDGRHELYVGDLDGTLRRTRLRDGRLGAASICATGAPALALVGLDVDGDGTDELVASGPGGRLALLDAVPGGCLEVVDVLDLELGATTTRLRRLPPAAPGAADRLLAFALGEDLRVIGVTADGFLGVDEILPPVRDVVALDVDLDGRPDLVAAGAPDQIRWLRRTEDGDFEPPVTIATVVSAVGLLAGDLDGDGPPDLVVLRGSSSVPVARVAVLRNLPGGLLGTPVDVGGPNDGDLLIVGGALLDVDADGVLDVVRTDSDGPNVRTRLLRGDGTGLLADAVRVPSIGDPGDLHVADLDGDGIDELVARPRLGFGSFVQVVDAGPGAFGDLALAPPSSASLLLDVDPGRPGDELVAVDADGVAVLAPDPDGGPFLTETARVSEPLPGLLVGDVSVRRGGAADAADEAALLVLGGGRRAIVVGPSAEGGTAPRATFLMLPSDARRVALLDVTGDGRRDLAVAREGVRTIELLDLAADEPELVGTLPYPLDAGAASLVAADLDGDGTDDLAIAHALSPAGLGGAWVHHGVPGGGLEPEPAFLGDGLNGPVLASDWNGDGVAELVRPLAGAVALRWAEHLGGRRYALRAAPIVDGPPADLPTGLPTGLAIVAGDLVGDGTPRILSVVRSGLVASLQVVSPLDGGRAARTRLAPSGGLHEETAPLTVGDLDGDGSPDLAGRGPEGRPVVRLGGPCPVRCPGDVDADGTAGLDDLLRLLGDFGRLQEDTVPDGLDLDGSGAVDLGDVLFVLADWGACPE